MTQGYCTGASLYHQLGPHHAALHITSFAWAHCSVTPRYVGCQCPSSSSTADTALDCCLNQWELFPTDFFSGLLFLCSLYHLKSAEMTQDCEGVLADHKPVSGPGQSLEQGVWKCWWTPGLAAPGMLLSCGGRSGCQDISRC